MSKRLRSPSSWIRPCMHRPTYIRQIRHVDTFIGGGRGRSRRATAPPPPPNIPIGGPRPSNIIVAMLLRMLHIAPPLYCVLAKLRNVRISPPPPPPPPPTYIASGGIRTHDRPLARRRSYQLSYRGSSAGWARITYTIQSNQSTSSITNQINW